MAPEYVLGAEPAELERLRHQHGVWRPLSEAAFDRVGVRAGWRVLDAGCGPGLVLADLRERVGPHGEIWGVDLVPAMLAEARRMALQRGYDNVRLLQGDLHTVSLPPDSFDLIWLRWVLSFPPDPQVILQRLAAALAPGGALVVQDYNHEGVSLFPESAGFAAAIRATRALYSSAGGDPWIGARLPRLFHGAGLRLEDYRGDVLTGGPGEPAFEWAQRFFPPYSAQFVARGLMSPAEREQFLAEWAERAADPHARYFSPIVVTATGRR
ncbi:MAG: methyltransferase domain-containing protein [Planctomycetota bacterium]|nr:MAG: methyltransferase domain-containing protein [Planctomycetota bacterium]